MHLIATSSTEHGIVSQRILLLISTKKERENWTHTMALIPPEDTNKAAASLDCRTAPSKSKGKQLKQKGKS